MQTSSWHSVMIAPLNDNWGGAVMGGIIFVIFFVVAVGVIASAFLLMHRKAVKDSRKVGAPDARRTATFRGGMWRPDTFNADNATDPC
jgi:hypothetical protein